MRADEVLALAKAHGVMIRPDGDDLDIIADHKPDPDLLAAIASFKPQIVAARRAERGRINRLIAGLIMNYPADRCLHCRKPIVAGQPWIPVSNGEATARFHKPCHAEWLGQQELTARRVLGLDP